MSDDVTVASVKVQLVGLYHEHAADLKVTLAYGGKEAVLSDQQGKYVLPS